MTVKHEFKVEMGKDCTEEVRSMLDKAEGISHFDVHLESNQVFVESELPVETILEFIRKTGKETHYVGAAIDDHKHDSHDRAQDNHGYTDSHSHAHDKHDHDSVDHKSDGSHDRAQDSRDH